MPQATKEVSEDGRPTYSCNGRFFCFHRRGGPTRVDPETGDRLDDVLVFRVADLAEKEILLADDRGVFFTRRRTGTVLGGAHADPPRWP